MFEAFVIFLGGGLGAIIRYFTMTVMNGVFPYGTVAVNLIGSFLVGLIAARCSEGSLARLLLIPGFLGGFTTYSAFALESLLMLKEGRMVTAVGYVTLTVSAGLLAAWFGSRLVA